MGSPDRGYTGRSDRDRASGDLRSIFSDRRVMDFGVLGTRGWYRCIATRRGNLVACTADRFSGELHSKRILGSHPIPITEEGRMRQTLMICVLLLTACGGQISQYDVAFASIEVGARAVVAVDDIVVEMAAPEIDRIGNELRQEAREARDEYEHCRSLDRGDCGNPPRAIDFMRRFDEQIRGWQMTVAGLIRMREGIVLGYALLQQWHTTKARPERWYDVCDLVAEGLRLITTGLDNTTATAPDVLEAARRALVPVCLMGAAP